jgi:hypothetical protein
MALPEMLSASSFSELAGLTLTQVRRLTRLRDLLVLQHSTVGARYPAWQFDGQDLLPGIRDLYREFGNDSWMVYDFLTQATEDQGQQAPLDILRQKDVDAVIATARLRRPASRWGG